jgi:hypothetical protein
MLKQNGLQFQQERFCVEPLRIEVALGMILSSTTERNKNENDWSDPSGLSTNLLFLQIFLPVAVDT